MNPRMSEDDDVCIHSIWPPRMCSICNGRVARERKAAQRSTVPRSAPFEARYPGQCAICGGHMEVGDLIVRLDVGYAHAGCPET